MKKSSSVSKVSRMRYAYRAISGAVINSEQTFQRPVPVAEAEAHIRAMFKDSATPLVSVNDTPVPEPTPVISNLTIEAAGGLCYRKDNCNHSASFPLLLIRNAWHKGADFEDLADGYGPGAGTMGGDWSGIRDSSDTAIAQMLERALNFLDLTA